MNWLIIINGKKISNQTTRFSERPGRTREGKSGLEYLRSLGRRLGP